MIRHNEINEVIEVIDSINDEITKSLDKTDIHIDHYCLFELSVSTNGDYVKVFFGYVDLSDIYLDRWYDESTNIEETVESYIRRLINLYQQLTAQVQITNGEPNDGRVFSSVPTN